MNNYIDHPYSIEARALRHFGQGEYFPLSAWLLKDGTLINGSYGGYQRDIDHREIEKFFAKAQGIDAVKKFMRRGNIRVMCHESGYVFQTIKQPTGKQVEILRMAEEEACCQGIPCEFYAVDVCLEPKRRLFYD